MFKKMSKLDWLWTGFQLVVAVILVGVLVWRFVPALFERFDNPSTKTSSSCPPGYKKCPSGDCILSTDVHAGCPS